MRIKNLDNFEFDEPIILCEGDFEQRIKILSVLVDGEPVEVSEPFLILDEGKSFFAVEINSD